MLIYEAICLLNKLDIKLPDNADDVEIKKVIRDIQRFLDVEIFIPLILYAILTLILSMLFANAMNNVNKKCNLYLPPCYNTAHSHYMFYEKICVALKY